MLTAALLREGLQVSADASSKTIREIYEALGCGNAAAILEDIARTEIVLWG